MPEFLKDPITVSFIVSGINVIAAGIVIVAALMVRKNRRHIEKTTKLLSEAAIHLEATFNSMLRTIVSIAELKQLRGLKLKDDDSSLDANSTQRIDYRAIKPEEDNKE